MSTDFVISTDSTVSRDSVDSSFYKTSEYFPCPHVKTIKHKTRLNCFKCGVCLHSDGVRAYKTQKMKYGTYFDPSKFYSSSLKQRISKIVIDQDSELYKNRNSLVEFVMETCDKLKLTMNTTHLSIMFMDFVLSKVPTIPTNLYQVYAATSVMLAAKSIELDERIPFISKVKRYSNLVAVNSKEFSQAEQVILKELNWNLQCVTPIDVMEYYLAQGVVFSSDYLSDESTNATTSNEDNALKEKNNQNDLTPSTAMNNKTPHTNKYTSGYKNDENKDFTSAFNNLSIGEKENNGVSTSSNTPNANLKKKVLISDLNDSRIFSIVQKIEKDYLRLANLIIRDYRFNDFDLKILSAASISFLRKVNGITPTWNKQLCQISNNTVTESMFQDCLNILENKFRSTFMPVISNNANTATKRPTLVYPNNSNTLLRDSENQNRVASYSSITPTKQMFRNNLSTHTSNNKVGQNSENTYKIAAKPLQFSHTNSNIIDHHQPTQFTIASNTVLNNKCSYTNYQYNNSYLSSQNINHHHGLSSNNNQNSQNIYPSSSNASTSSNLTTNNTYLRNGSSQYQPSSYIGQARFGSNII